MNLCWKGLAGPIINNVTSTTHLKTTFPKPAHASAGYSRDSQGPALQVDPAASAQPAIQEPDHTSVKVTVLFDV